MVIKDRLIKIKKMQKNKDEEIFIKKLKLLSNTNIDSNLSDYKDTTNSCNKKVNSTPNLFNRRALSLFKTETSDENSFKKNYEKKINSLISTSICKEISRKKPVISESNISQSIHNIKQQNDSKIKPIYQLYMTSQNKSVRPVQKESVTRETIDNKNNLYLKSSEEIVIRKSNFSVISTPNWYDKNGLPTPSFSGFLLKNVDYQYSIINDEIKVLMDNLHFLKINYLLNNDMVDLFRNMETQLQIKFNKCLEETCGLIMKIPNMILLDFSQYIERFVSIQPPSPQKFIPRLIKDEEKALIYNCSLVCEINVFFKSVIEVYSILINQVDDMIISNNIFTDLIQFLSRCRFNISYLITTSKNSMMNMKNDIKCFNKYFNSVKREINEKKSITNDHYLKKPSLPSLSEKQVNDTQKVKLSEKIKKNLVFKSNYESDKIARLNAVLTNDKITFEESFEKNKSTKKNITHESALNSNLMTKMLKYISKDIKDTILSQRIIDRYKEKNIEQIIHV